MCRLLAFLDPLLRGATQRTTARPGRLRFVTMKPTRGNSCPRWNSTFATTHRAPVYEFAPPVPSIRLSRRGVAR